MSPETIERPLPMSVPLPALCRHERLIDEVLSRDGTRTGQVQCRECGVVFPDPYHGMK